jgi:hypothetical protein
MRCKEGKKRLHHTKAKTSQSSKIFSRRLAAMMMEAWLEGANIVFWDEVLVYVDD